MRRDSNGPDISEERAVVRQPVRSGGGTRSAAALPAFDDRWALFLDVDGTLLEFSETPEETRLQPGLIQTIEKLQALVPVALVSGRRISDLDRLFAPIKLPAGGQHGAERRRADGSVCMATLDRPSLESAKEALGSWARRHRGAFFEDKGLTFAIHYRAAPHLKSGARRSANEANRLLGGEFEVVSGNMIFELRPKGWNKGRAISEFMSEEPFTGRVPVFWGDDATDEDGFTVVNGLGGLSIKVGDGPTAAKFRAPDVRGVLRCLGEYARQCELRARGGR